MKKFYLFILSIILQGILKVNGLNGVPAGNKEADESPFDVIWKENVKQWTTGPQWRMQPELFEGDIVMTAELKRTIDDLKYAYKTNTAPYHAIRGQQWPNGVVPYVFAPGFNANGRQVVRQAIRHYQKRAPCITWRLRTKNDRRYVIFFHGGGCYAMIGRQDGPQRISLASPGCLQLGVTVHQMMHCLGFYHEQSRSDRDKYITINWRNMNQNMKHNFEMYLQASTLGEPYDKFSVMHYGNYAFSINQRKTIVSKANPNQKLSQRRGLSRIDIIKLNKYYCGGTTTKESGCQDSYRFCVAFRSSSNKKWCMMSWPSKYCRKSCKTCPPSPKPKKTCKVKDNPKWKLHCVTWSAKGFCKTNHYKEWMRANCEKSCGVC